MKKSFIQKTITGLLAVTLVGIAFQARAEDKTNALAAKAEATAPKHDKLPFGGTLSAVDKTAMTITVKKKEAEKTFQITSTTKITKAGKPAMLNDAVVGEDCGVFYKKTADGKLEALSLRLGAKPEKGGEKKAEEKATAKPEKK